MGMTMNSHTMEGGIIGRCYTSSYAITHLKLCSIAFGALAWLYFSSGNLAHAYNGYTYVNVCSCATTTDFTNAAYNTATSHHQIGVNTFTLVSTTTPRSAYIQITGSVIYLDGVFVWQPGAAIPVDSTGASIASETESEKEAFYGSLDQTLFNTSRDTPIFSTSSQYFPGSFINSTDTQVSADIDNFLESMGIGVGVGSTFTAVFADGTSAEFTAQPTGTNPPWKWNGVAHNKQKQPINRNGTVIKNPNTSGTGGGSLTAPGFGSGSTWSWLLDGGNDCFVSGYIYLPDGSSFGSNGWGPC
jgi:hypothetical protein